MEVHPNGSTKPQWGLREGVVTSECPNWARSKNSSGQVLILHKEARAGRWEATVQDLLAEVVRTQPPDAEFSARCLGLQSNFLLGGDLKAYEGKGICPPCTARVRGGPCSPG